LLAIKDRSCVIALRRCDFVFQNHRADDIRPYDIRRPFSNTGNSPLSTFHFPLRYRLAAM